MTRDIIQSDRGPRAIGPYAQAVRCDGWIFASGQIALDPATGSLVEGDVRVQTRRVLENLKGILEDSGADLGAVVKTTVYLRDLGDFPAMNEVYAGFFPAASPPARATVQVARLPLDVAVEIDAIARVA